MDSVVQANDMTVEEMAKQIKAFCGKQISCNYGCPLANVEVCYELSTEMNDAEKIAIKKNYAFLAENGFFDSDDPVNHPSHYTQGGIECIDAMLSAFGKEELSAYCKIAAFKYIWRCDRKNGDEDIEKAIWFLTKYLELKKGNE